MAELRDDEIRRLLKYVSKEIQDTEKLAQIEDELRSDFAAEFLREPEILSNFHSKVLELSINETNWYLKIIGYTKLRMVQRGINQDAIVSLFTRFVEFCETSEQPIIVGAYTIYGKPSSHRSAITLRIDIDAVDDKQGSAHTVTVFVGRGGGNETEVINLM